MKIYSFQDLIDLYLWGVLTGAIIISIFWIALSYFDKAQSNKIPKNQNPYKLKL